MAADTQVARLLAPAKLTVGLRITGIRPDGYHFIDAEMVTLDLCDEVIVHRSSVSSVEIAPVAALRNGPHAAPEWDIPTDRSNLVIRALELAGRTAHVEVRKRIPPGGGLGGGSADAAAVLRWANRLTASERPRPDAVSDASGSSASVQPNASASPPTDAGELSLITPQQAAALGADVAFCLVGGRARVTGVGEIVEPLGFRAQSFVLWTPPIQVDTATVYGTWDALGGPKGDTNDLEPAALAAYPELSTWRDELEAVGGRTPQLAGSGGTWFISAPHSVLPGLLPDAGVSAVQARAIGRL